ncbi:MAG: glycosyl hydrolase 108 family protein [Janthinobacterium lividum]
MKTSFAATKAFILNVEKGYSNDPNDNGNWTGGKKHDGRMIGSNKGVCAPELETYLGRAASVADMRNLTDAMQSAIFGANYWNRLNGNELPLGLDLMAVDHSYNRGAVTGAKLLQRLLGVLEDGHIGEVTVAAAGTVTAADILTRVAMLDAIDLQTSLGVARDGDVGRVTQTAFLALPQRRALVVAFCAARVHDYGTLRQVGEYGRGWDSRAEQAMHEAAVLLSAAA